MTLSRVGLFITGMIFGILIFVLTIWVFRDAVIKKIKPISFFGSTLKHEVVVIQKDSKLYQGNSEIGFLKKGSVLEYTQHVDKVDHYNLSILFEAGAHEKALDLFSNPTKNYSTSTDLIPK